MVLKCSKNATVWFYGQFLSLMSIFDELTQNKMLFYDILTVSGQFLRFKILEEISPSRFQKRIITLPAGLMQLNFFNILE